MLTLGLILIGVALILLLVRYSEQNKLRIIRSTEILTAKQLIELAGQVARDLQSLSQRPPFRQIVAVKGIIRCDSPLTSEVAGEPCVYYSMSVTREYEETYEEQDSKGRSVWRTRRGSEPLSSNARSTPFWVEDATGRVLVDPQGASIDTVQVANRFEPAERATAISFGNLVFNVGALPTSGRRTLGYRICESILPVGRAVYVLGEASDWSGQLIIQKPQGKDTRFIVSLKSEEEIIRSSENTIRWLKFGAIASGATGLLLTVIGIFER